MVFLQALLKAKISRDSLVQGKEIPSYIYHKSPPVSSQLTRNPS